YADKNIQQEIELLLLGAVCPGVKKYECFPLQRVNKVTNITGSKDIVVRAAGLFPGYEATGYKGFNEIYGFKNIKTDWNHTGYANRKNLKFIMDELGK
ncbi:MAG TPA: hypothetical protein PLM72_10830, partial [Spirochaetota bacterium]|nr:hypothetical protein [Spirochaetota bacterium]